MQYVYIHGFGTTGALSTKFLKIQTHALNTASTAYALEWNENQLDIVNSLESQLCNCIDFSQPICLIGSSTGGNFTYQLLQNIKEKAKEIYVVLLNPFIDVKQRKIDDSRFPISLANQMTLPADTLENAVVLLGKQDEVLNYEFTQDLLEDKNTLIVKDDCNHSLNNIPTADFLNYIDRVWK